MKRSVRVAALAALVVVVGLSLLLATRPPSDATRAPSPLLGRLAPLVAGRELSGGTFSSAALRGRVVVVNFWASWCGPCQVEAPQLSLFAEHERARDVVLVGVVFNDSIASAQAFARRYGSLYPSLVDPGGAIANHYGVTSPPTTFVLDRHGRVAAELLGATNAAQLERAVAAVRS